GPKCVMRLPIASSAGRARPRALASPPTIIVSVPSIAPFSPPDTGASSQNSPFDLASSASSRVTCGEIVLMSMMIDPGFAAANMPFSPRATATTSGESVTIVMMISLADATSAGVLTACALPGDEFSAANFSALPGGGGAEGGLKPVLDRVARHRRPIYPKADKADWLGFSLIGWVMNPGGGSPTVGGGVSIEPPPPLRVGLPPQDAIRRNITSRV